MTFLLGLAGSIWTKALFLGAAALVVVGILFSVRRSGKVAERAEQLEKINEMVREQKKGAVRIRSMPSSTLNSELRQQRDQLRKLLQSG